MGRRRGQPVGPRRNVWQRRGGTCQKTRVECSRLKKRRKRRRKIRKTTTRQRRERESLRKGNPKCKGKRETKENKKGGDTNHHGVPLNAERKRFSRGRYGKRVEESNVFGRGKQSKSTGKGLLGMSRLTNHRNLGRI